MSFNHVTEADLKFFEELLPGRVFSGEAISTDYDHDEMTIYGHYMPEVVVQTLTTEEVSAVMKYCNEHKIPVTPAAQVPVWLAALSPSAAVLLSAPPA